MKMMESVSIQILNTQENVSNFLIVVTHATRPSFVGNDCGMKRIMKRTTDDIFLK
jgi:hypothetical protein